MDIQVALLMDIVLLLGSLWCILQTSDRSIFNPSIWYVALHAYTVTFRLIALNLGGRSLAVIGIRSDAELVDAAIASDISLVAVVAATILVSRRMSKYNGSGSLGGQISLSYQLGQVTSIICLTIGTLALLKFGAAAKATGADTSGIDIGRFDESSYPIWISGFAVQGALIQCAIRGFTRWRVILLLSLLFLSSFNARTVFVLAAAMAFLIYQTRHNQSSMPLKGAIGIVLLGLVWFVYKPVSVAIVSGASVQDIWLTAQGYFENSASNDSSIDTQFLDMQATYMAAADEAGRRFYGATMLPLLYLPIPRFIWPDKPRLNEYSPELSSSSRMIAQVGMTPNLTGESYLNFGWAGCAVVPFLYLLGMQTAYRSVRIAGIDSAARWVYMIYLVSMVQIYRDGLNSLILFPFMVYFPMLCWGVISSLSPAGKIKVHLPSQRTSVFEANVVSRSRPDDNTY
jgi:hypothetical protein